MMPTSPAPSPASTYCDDGAGSPRAPTNASITSSDERYIPASTTGTANVRLLKPPR
jgi:hypothetical protein